MKQNKTHTQTTKDINQMGEDICSTYLTKDSYPIHTKHYKAMKKKDLVQK